MSKTFLYGKAINFTLNKLFAKLNIAFYVIWVCFLGEFHFRHFLLCIAHDFCQCIVRLNCDWVKVTHHGSKGNNSDDLYDHIVCSNYLFSVDGENKHYLPNKEAIARILRNKNRNIIKQPYSFYFTYDNPTLRRIFAVDGDRVFKTLNRKTYPLVFLNIQFKRNNNLPRQTFEPFPYFRYRQ